MGAVGQIFALKVIGENYLEKFVAFMNLEKANNRVDGKGLLDAMRMYGVKGCLPKEIRLCKVSLASVHMNGQWRKIDITVSNGHVASSFSVYQRINLHCDQY